MNYKKKLIFCLNSQGSMLIELIFSIVILATTLVSVLLVFQSSIQMSADPMILQQAISIGKSYLDEISLKQFPTGTCSGTPSGTRATWETICDYHNLSNSGAVDQTGASVSGLEQYTVQVAVQQNSAADLQGLTGAANQVIRIDVMVTHPNLRLKSDQLILSLYKTNYGT